MCTTYDLNKLPIYIRHNADTCIDKGIKKGGGDHFACEVFHHRDAVCPFLWVLLYWRLNLCIYLQYKTYEHRNNTALLSTQIYLVSLTHTCMNTFTHTHKHTLLTLNTLFIYYFLRGRKHKKCTLLPVYPCIMRCNKDYFES